MEKFSVKKPFTVLVAVIAILVVGFVSLSKMPMDLLPSMNLPYVMVITPYPGASPEKIQHDVTEPMEQSLGTISHVKNVGSVSSENYCLIQLEFEDGTDMDSSLVRISTAVDQVSQTLPEMCGTPSIMEISMDMIASMYLAVEHGDDNIYELSDYATNELIPQLKRVDGVASITDIGLVEKTVQVDLNGDKIVKLNDRILKMTSDKLDDAYKQLKDAQDKVTGGQAELESQESNFGNLISSGIFGALNGPITQTASNLKAQIDETIAYLNDLSSKLPSGSPSGPLPPSGSVDIDALQKAYDQALAAQTDAAAQVTAAQAAVDTAQAEYDAASQVIADAGDAVTEDMNAALDASSAKLVAAQSSLMTATVNKANADAAVTFAKAALDAAKGSTAAVPSKNTGIDVETAARLKNDIQEVTATLQDTSASLSSAATLSELMKAVTTVSGSVPQIQNIQSQLASRPGMPSDLTGTIARLSTALTKLSEVMLNIPSILNTLQTTFGSLTQGQLDAAVGFSTAAIQLTTLQSQLSSAMTQFEDARQTALDSAYADKLLTPSVLSQMIYAQNFSMPAGYIDDENDNSWLLRVGDEYDNTDSLEDALLCHIDGLGAVRLTDVADVTVIDNAGDNYARLNGSQGIILCLYKSSSAGTNEVSKAVNAAIADMEAADPDLHIVPLMDQGHYIEILIKDILESILLGALLAIIVLALFLRTVRPTIIVALSIPLSVFCALVLMYFSGLSLNIMTLSGLALGIGMLVDNSIVVIENIFRLRLQGVSAPRAAVQGTRQVSGALIASTLTTVCVFLPMVFTTGTVRTLCIPLALSISYCLIASLIVAMTVVPASASTILKNVNQKPGGILAKVQEAYGRSLRFCLNHKAYVLSGAIILLVVCILRLLSMGLILIPEMESESIEVDITTDEAMDRETSYAKADEVLNRLMTVDGVKDVGVMDQSSSAGLVTSLAGSSSSYGTYIYYIGIDENYKGSLKALGETLEAATADITDCEISVTASAMGDMSMMMSSGLGINIYGKDKDSMQTAADDVMAMIDAVDGFENISDGSADDDASLHLVIDKDKAMAYGFTVAQIYGEISSRLTTSVTSTSVTVDKTKMNVVIHDTTHELTRENILDIEFTETDMTGGQQAAVSGDMSALMGAMGDKDNSADAAEEEEESKVHKLGEFAHLEETTAPDQINRKNMTPYITVSATTAEGYNTTLLSRELQTSLDAYEAPAGVTIEMGGETSQVSDMIVEMSKLLALALLFIYLVMVAQFQSLLSPFIVMFTIPLAFTGGMIGLIVSGEQVSLMALLGFLILVGTVVNNGIVFVDYTNQLRMGGLKRHDALIATGKTRMRPILMTAITTILAMSKLMFGSGMSASMGRAMAIVIAGGLLYATLMTLYIIPVMYDILFKRNPLTVDVGSDIDDTLDDAAEYLKTHAEENSND